VLAIYVSGHGFGHSTRTAEVLREVRARAPGLPIAVRTSAPAFLFEGVVAPPLTVHRVSCDVGLVQHDALAIDEAATVAAWRVFRHGWDDRVAGEAAWLRASGARLVLGDIPPLAFEAAAEAGVPSIALGNFSWDWIYAHIARREPALREAAARAAETYARAEFPLRLPFAGDLSAFRRIEDIPLVARSSQPSAPGISRRTVAAPFDVSATPTSRLLVRERVRVTSRMSASRVTSRETVGGSIEVMSERSTCRCSPASASTASTRHM
jgi:L-arabinokinase